MEVEAEAACKDGVELELELELELVGSRSVVLVVERNHCVSVLA